MDIALPATPEGAPIYQPPATPSATFPVTYPLRPMTLAPTPYVDSLTTGSTILTSAGMNDNVELGVLNQTVSLPSGTQQPSWHAQTTISRVYSDRMGMI